MHNKNIFMQHVIVGWTKASRGAPLSTVRNACAKAFSLTDSELDQLIAEPSSSVIIMNEGTQFHPYKRIDVGISRAWPVSIRRTQKDVATVRYQFSGNMHGAPSRTGRPPIKYPLSMDSLLRVEFNSRDAFYIPQGKWQYYLHTFNIMHTKQPSTTMFMAEPTKTISDLEDLW